MISVVRSRQCFAVVSLAVFSVFLPACNRDSGEPKLASTSQPNIVIVVVDTLRADHLSAYGYARTTTPNIDAWFADGLRCDSAYATASYTPSSVVSILTGLYPQCHGVRMFLQPIHKDLESIPRRLKESGYETAAFVSNINLQSNWIGLNEHFEHYDDTLPQREAFRDSSERIAVETTNAVLEWLKNRKDPKRPYFLLVHYIDPHGPYAAPTPLVKDFAHDPPVPIEMDKLPPYQRIPGVADGFEYIDRYDEEIAYADSHIGRLFGELERVAPSGNTVYLLTADHGETLMDHRGWFQHMYHVYEELVRVPLLMRGPGIQAGVLKTPVSGVDIAPTLYAALGLPAASPLDGVSLLGPLPDRPVFTESYVLQNSLRWHAMIQNGKKWMITNPPVTEQGYPGTRYTQLFDLATDPHETITVLWDLDEPAAQPLVRHIAQDPEDATVLQSAIDSYSTRLSDFEEVQERLRALGYL